MQTNTPKGFSFGRLVYGTSLRRTLLRAALLGAVVFIVFRFVFIGVRVDGASMAPTYADKGVNLVNRLAYKHASPRRGDVVAIWMRENSHSILLMKRVVGLPGEAVGFEQGHVTINGARLDEPYLRFLSDWNREPVLCGPDEYFVVGDNRSMPMEDHQFGRAKAKLIAGRIVL